MSSLKRKSPQQGKGYARLRTDRTPRSGGCANRQAVAAPPSARKPARRTECPLSRLPGADGPIFSFRPEDERKRPILQNMNVKSCVKPDLLSSRSPGIPASCGAFSCPKFSHADTIQVVCTDMLYKTNFCMAMQKTSRRSPGLLSMHKKNGTRQERLQAKVCMPCRELSQNCPVPGSMLQPSRTMLSGLTHLPEVCSPDRERSTYPCRQAKGERPKRQLVQECLSCPRCLLGRGFATDSRGDLSGSVARDGSCYWRVAAMSCFLASPASCSIAALRSAAMCRASARASR